MFNTVLPNTLHNKRVNTNPYGLTALYCSEDGHTYILVSFSYINYVDTSQHLKYIIPGISHDNISTDCSIRKDTCN